MRNLKRLLALTLSTLLLSGSLVLGASAASSGFTDSDQIIQTEAVDVMTGLGVFTGSSDGAFHPDDVLTREQAAKIICSMMGVQTNAALLEGGSQLFTDVEADRWSAPYIAYCVEHQILTGNGNGQFYPEQPLSGAAFAKMLLVALGYDPEAEGYTGTDWLLNVASAAMEVGIAIQDMNLIDNVTRQDAALMCYRTLTCNMVYYTGVNNLTNRLSAVKVDGYYDRDYNGSQDGIQQFCEAYLPDLLLVTDYDSFGRPGSSWCYQDESIYYSARTPAAVFSLSTSAQQIADALPSCSFKNTYLYAAGERISATKQVSFNAAANLTFAGSEGRSTQSACWIDNQTTAGFLADLTQNGRQVEIYTGEKNVITDIVVITYQVDTLSSVTAASGMTIYTIGGKGYADYRYSSDDTAVVYGPVQAGDTVTYAVADGVAHIYPTRQVTGILTSLEEDQVMISGETYPLGTAVSGLPVLTEGTEGVFSLDQSGSVVDVCTSEISSGYAQLLSIEGSLQLPEAPEEPAEGETVVDGDEAELAPVAESAQPLVTASLVLSDGTVGQFSVALQTLTDTDLGAGGPYGKNGAFGPESSNNPAGVTEGGAGYVSEKAVTLEAGDVVIRNTNLLVYDVSADGTEANGQNTSQSVNDAAALSGIWAYTRQGDTVSLYPLSNASGNMTACNVYLETGLDISSMGGNELTHGHYVLSIDNKTVFVVYDPAVQQAVCYQGIANLPAAVSGMEDASVVIRALTPNSGGAAVVFATVAH